MLRSGESDPAAQAGFICGGCQNIRCEAIINEETALARPCGLFKRPFGPISALIRSLSVPFRLDTKAGHNLSYSTIDISLLLRL